MGRRERPPILVPLEELMAKFKSKFDMYTIMSVDSRQF